jgi:hypothetical protein
VSTVDLAGAGLTLLTGPASEAWRVAAAATPAPVEVEVRELDALSARALGVPPGAALLVRPDSVPAALVGDPAGVRDAVAAVTARSFSVV